MLHGTRLTAHSAAGDVDYDVKLTGSFCDLERLLSNHAMNAVEKILLNTFVVDGDLAGSRPQKHTGCRCLATACSVILGCTQMLVPLRKSSLLAAAGPYADANFQNKPSDALPCACAVCSSAACP